jgi:hypothetical protein
MTANTAIGKAKKRDATSYSLFYDCIKQQKKSSQAKHNIPYLIFAFISYVLLMNSSLQQ